MIMIIIIMMIMLIYWIMAADYRLDQYNTDIYTLCPKNVYL